MTIVSKEALVLEAKRLSETNRPVTRVRWRKEAEFSEHAVRREFGTHQEMLRAANLLEGREVRKYDLRKSHIESETRIKDYIDVNVMPWVRNEPHHRETDHAKLVVGSDFHGRHVSRFALDVFLQVNALAQPDVVVLNGDVVDFEEVGRWTSSPTRMNDIQGEIDFVVDEILAPVREAAPNAQIDYVIGNHEYRLQRYLAESAPGLATLRCLEYAELFKLDELDINLVFGGALIAPTERKRRENYIDAYKVYWDTFAVTHGTATGPQAGSKELNRFGIPGTSGHLHTHNTFSNPKPDRPHAEWNVTGMMSDPAVGHAYMGGLPTRWGVGFGVVDIFPKNKTHFFNHIHCRDGLAVWEGHVFEKAK